MKSVDMKSLRIKSLGLRSLGLRSLGIKTLDIKALGIRSLAIKTLDMKSLEKLRRFSGLPRVPRGLHTLLWGTRTPQDSTLSPLSTTLSKRRKSHIFPNRARNLYKTLSP